MIDRMDRTGVALHVLAFHGESLGRRHAVSSGKGHLEAVVAGFVKQVFEELSEWLLVHALPL